MFTSIPYGHMAVNLDRPMNKMCSILQIVYLNSLFEWKLVCLDSDFPERYSLKGPVDVLHFQVFIFILFDENFYILIQISLNFVPDGPIDNKLALVQILAWHWIGDKQLSETKDVIWHH